MDGSTVFDHYYGDESSQFSFYRIPRQLVAGQQFKKISTDAKLLYGLLLDRMGLSARNGWYDDAGRVYIFYTLDEIQEDLNCGHEKAVKLLSELDTDKGCGLIERVKQGQGRPTKIYVKRFTTRRVPAETPAPQETPRLPKIGSQEVGKSEVKSSDNPKSRLPIFRSADFGKSDGNYTESNQTDFSYTDPSIHPSPSTDEQRWMDRSEYLKEIKENIEYPFLCQQFNRDDVDEVVGLMADVMCSTQQTIRIGGNDIPLTQVQARFYRLDYSMMVYVFESLHRNTTKVRNIRAYLLTTLGVNRETQDYKDLFESIKNYGIREPVLCRPGRNGGLEIISGHRRHDIGAQLNYPIPVLIERVDEDDAQIQCVDGNLHRKDIPLSELARAAQMKMDALKRKAGRRSKADILAGKEPMKRSDEQVGENLGMSRASGQRLMRVNQLEEPLKKMVDKKELPLDTAEQISHMKPAEQKTLADAIEKEGGKVPSKTEAVKLKEESRAGTLTPQKIEKSVAPTKRESDPPLKVTFQDDELRPYFPEKGTTVATVKRTMFEAMDLRKRALERQKAKTQTENDGKKRSEPAR